MATSRTRTRGTAVDAEPLGTPPAAGRFGATPGQGTLLGPPKAALSGSRYSGLYSRLQALNSFAAVFGAGAGGRRIAKTLGELGIGAGVVVDPEDYEEENLGVQDIHENDINSPKAVSTGGCWYHSIARSEDEQELFSAKPRALEKIVGCKPALTLDARNISAHRGMAEDVLAGLKFLPKFVAPFKTRIWELDDEGRPILKVDVPQGAFIFLSCVDSMKSRRAIFEDLRKRSWKETPAFLVDSRASAMGARSVFVNLRCTKAHQLYTKTLYTDEDALEEPCAARMSVHSAMITAALVGRRVLQMFPPEGVKEPTFHDFVVHLGEWFGSTPGLK